MYYSIRGKIVHVDHKFIVVESCGVGYQVFVSKPKSFVLGEETFLYVHHHIKEDDEYLAGFTSLEEKNVFNLLLHVNGIGPKSALFILSKVNSNDLLAAISNNDYDFLNRIDGISPRVISQMMLDLKDYIAKSNKEDTSQFKEVRLALKALGFKLKEIDPVLLSIYIPNATKDMILKEALRRLNYAKNNR